MPLEMWHQQKSVKRESSKQSVFNGSDVSKTARLSSQLEQCVAAKHRREKAVGIIKYHICGQNVQLTLVYNLTWGYTKKA